ncbi:thioesterase family protein [Alsobacter sp. SYSU M60028]|uniref:Thioesterase family protein n=1 Tax=Alsobacter ponti TaxID=2962936 RepID=A0ABT1L811_9HYPH|nr:thioesterase family protein [Alsobacter ponti]MCP8937196.1 thioesterase family protein [Alsobacter ponti]
MSAGIDAKPLFFAPFVSSRMAIEPGWIDYNGHLNMAYYAVLFDRALDEALGALGLGPDYARDAGFSTFTGEWRIRYARELGLDDPVRVTVQLIEFDDKRMHFYMEMRHARELWMAAAVESLNLHVDLARRKVAPFPADILASLAIMKAAHSGLPRPPTLGEAIGIPKKAKSGRPGVH